MITISSRSRLLLGNHCNFAILIADAKSRAILLAHPAQTGTQTTHQPLSQTSRQIPHRKRQQKSAAGSPRRAQLLVLADLHFSASGMKEATKASFTTTRGTTALFTT